MTTPGVELVKKKLKSIAFEFLANPVRLRQRLDKLAQSDASVILSLHRVAPDDGSSYRPLSPEIFEALLSYVKKEFSLCPIGDLAKRSDRPKLALSFDDGYLDFYTYAMPLLSKHGVKVNQNVIPSCMETGRPPLNVMAQDFIGQAPAELVNKLDIPGFFLSNKHHLSERLSSFLKFSPTAQRDELEKYLLPQFERFEGFAPTAMMSLDQVKHVGQLHELGAHSYSHASMAHESPEFFRQDVQNCKSYFREKLGLAVNIYAFPNGSYRTEHLQILRDEGIAHALLVGETFADGQLNRFTFDAAGESEMRYKATGRRAPIAA
ncbi:MAG: polysaccharide deacetylase family protein [Alphaproteobacteria bacterium]|nr:polysaccharide deacetylase family protein [Alphaproteobacteria bacterium]